MKYEDKLKNFLEHFKDCPNVDLSGAYLRGVDLSSLKKETSGNLNIETSKGSKQK